MKRNESCPVDYQQLDQNLARSYAFVIFVMLMLIVFLEWKWLAFLLLADFFLRMIFGMKRGFFCLPLARLLKLLNISPSPVNALPKKFAVKVGFVFSLALTVVYLSGWSKSFEVLSYIFAAAVGLEAFFNFCLACVFYNFFRGRSRLASDRQEQGIFK